MAKQEDNTLFALTSFLYGGNADYIDRLYAVYEEDPNSVDAEWQEFFAKLGDSKEDVLKNANGASWQRQNWPLKAESELISALDGNWHQPQQEQKTIKQAPQQAKDAPSQSAKQTQAEANTANDVIHKAPSQAELQKAAQDSLAALALVRAYKTYGHLRAKLDPLGFSPKPEDYDLLKPEYYGFKTADYEREIYVDGALGLQYATLSHLLAELKSIYCSTIGAEFMHITNPERKNWLEERFNALSKAESLSDKDKKQTLQKLIEAEGFEKFLDTKYKGTKRFGLDGGEALIPALDKLIHVGADLGVEEVILGMAHRGRLNVLTQILSKPHHAVFHEFKGGSYKPDDVAGSGDVKYHLGSSNNAENAGKTVHLSLVPNPSHLEIVDPVVLGKSRGRQDVLAKKQGENKEISLEMRHKVMPVLIHGDAAFAGQGVVAESFNLSELNGYTVAGSVHIIINNQIGFTTNPQNARSSRYCSDLAKMIEAPIFHVNGDDPEAVLKIIQLAAEYRHKFHKSIVIDMTCYRRFGHNEGDEPKFTQPLMYQNIHNHTGIVAHYGQKLIAENLITEDELQNLQRQWREKMQTEFDTEYLPNKANWLEGEWAHIRQAGRIEEQNLKKTGLAKNQLKEIAQQLTHIPETFQLHKTVKRFIDNRKKMLETEQGVDWSMAEALAFGSLLVAGHPVRLSGEDVERGTFSHRHSVFYDQESQNRYVALNHLTTDQANYEVVNSLLSEEAVLGYEYGYSLVDPKTLTLWEAQFGDFANGAQTVFDQFISASEQKWLRLSGLVCLLPHGFEGQGPEHSSARLERYLQLCAEDNMQVANCTTPANYFHILRRQVEREFRKPLILMTPKSLLRHKKAVSALADFTEDTAFKPVLADSAELIEHQDFKLKQDTKIRRVILCSGKVYYDLYEEREKLNSDDVYIIRLEQLYPFPAQALADILQRFKQAEVIWCQEEPKNMGAWSFVAPYVEWVLQHIGAEFGRPHYIGRPAAASPATGLVSEHKHQLAAFLEKAFSQNNLEH